MSGWSCSRGGAAHFCGVIALHAVLLPFLRAASTSTYLTDNTNHNRHVLLTDEELHQYCQWEKFNATCRQDEVVVVQSARYGRMRFGRCVTEDHGHVGCSADVRAHLDVACSGRHQCIFNMDHSMLRQNSDCPKEIMSYLEAEYTCIKGKFL